MTLIVRKEPVQELVDWLNRSAGHDPTDPRTLILRVIKLQEEIGEVAGALDLADNEQVARELCDVIVTAEVAALSLAPGNLPRTVTAPYGAGYRDRPFRHLVMASGKAASGLIGWTGQNPRKGVTHSMADVVALINAVTAAAYALLRTVEMNSQGLLDSHLIRLVERAGAPADGRTN